MYPANYNPKNNKGNYPQGSVEGIIEIEGQKKLAQEFITIGDSFEEALGRCVLRDDAQKNAVIIYKAQLEMFEMWDEIQDLTNWLNASASVGGFNRSLAAMTETGIIIGEGLGVKIGKDSQKALQEMQKFRAMQNQENHNNGNGDKGGM